MNFLDQSHSALERDPNAKPITFIDLENWAAPSDARLIKARRDKSHKLPAANGAHTDNSNEGKEQGGRGGRGRGGNRGRGGRNGGRANGAQGGQDHWQEEEPDFVPNSCMVLTSLTSAEDSEEIDIVNNSPDTPSGLQVSARDNRACVTNVPVAPRTVLPGTPAAILAIFSGHFMLIKSLVLLENSMFHQSPIHVLSHTSHPLVLM
jgi:hypothetical protein